MSARTIIDGAGVTNHFSVSFDPWVAEANVISISGLGDEVEIIDGPDGRGYSTGKVTKREVTIVIADHEPAVADFVAWKEAVENGAPNHVAVGLITRMDAKDQPIQIWELERSLCFGHDENDMSIDGAEVGQATFKISCYRAKLIGP